MWGHYNLTRQYRAPIHLKWKNQTKKTVRSHSCTFTRFFRSKPLRRLRLKMLSTKFRQHVCLKKTQHCICTNQTQPSSQPFFLKTKNDAFSYTVLTIPPKRTTDWFLTSFFFSSDPQDDSVSQQHSPNFPWAKGTGTRTRTRSNRRSRRRGRNGWTACRKRNEKNDLPVSKLQFPSCGVYCEVPVT